jgi:hypothetical protein
MPVPLQVAEPVLVWRLRSLPAPRDRPLAAAALPPNLEAVEEARRILAGQGVDSMWLTFLHAVLRECAARAASRSQ